MIIIKNTSEEQTVYVPKSEGAVVKSLYELQDKTVEITENGTTVVTPTGGAYGLGAVEVVVKTPQYQLLDVTIRDNGTFVIRPDEGYAGLTGVDLHVDVQPTMVLPAGARFGYWQDATIPWTLDFQNITNADYMFAGGTVDSNTGGVSRLVELPTIVNADNITSMDSFLRHNRGIVSFTPPFSTSKVTSLANAFYYGDVAEVDFRPSGGLPVCTDMANMFRECPWDGSSSSTIVVHFGGTPMLTNTSNMFTAAWISEYDGLDLSNVTNASGMFYSAERLVNGGVFEATMPKVTSLAQFAYRAKAFKSIKITTSSALTNLNTFAQWSSGTCVLESVEVTDTSKVTGMSYAFAMQSVLTSIKLGGMESLTTAPANIFQKCSALTDVDGLDGLTWNISFSDSPNLTMQSLTNIINQIGTTTRRSTLTLNATTKAMLTDDLISIATSKGWTIA